MLRIFHSLPRAHKVLLLPVATMVTVLGTQKIIGVFDDPETSQTQSPIFAAATVSEKIISSAAETSAQTLSSSLVDLAGDIPLADLKPLEVVNLDVIPEAQADGEVPLAASVDLVPTPFAQPVLAKPALDVAQRLPVHPDPTGADVASIDGDDEIGGTSYEDWSFDNRLELADSIQLGDEIDSQKTYVPEWQTYTIQSGDSFALTAERTLGLEYNDVVQILDEVPDQRVLTRWRVGRSFDYKLDEDGQLIALRVMQNPRDGYLIERDTETTAFAYSPIENVSEASQRMFNGTVSGSFALSAQSTGLSNSEVSELTDILSKKLDFRRNARAGDHFQVLVESDMIDGESMDSKILAAQYEGERMDLTVIRNSADDNFYMPDGTGLEPGFKRHPFEGDYRISSPFNLRRHHPVTGRISPHKGTDFAMRSGTPVESPAAGRVERVVSHPLAGNYVVIRHDNGYTTRFLHLSRVLVSPGSRVEMGQEIALSGNTGRTTGPHLHYEVMVNNRQVDPMRVQLPESQSLTGQALADFRAESENLLAKLDQHEDNEPSLASVNVNRRPNDDDNS